MAGLIQSNGSLSRFPVGLFASTIAGGAWRDPETLRIEVLPVPPAEDAHRAALVLHGLNPRIAMPGIRRAPTYRPSRAPILEIMPAAVRECRRLTMAIRSNDRVRLGVEDQNFLAEIIRWRREPSAYEAERVAEIAERVFWIERDGMVA